MKVLNKDITKGLVYPVINGQIVARNGYNENGFGAKDVEITGAAKTLIQDARPSWGYYAGTLTANEIFNKDKALSSKLTGHKDNFATLKVFNVTTDGDLITATEIDKAAKLPEGIDNYDVFVIYGWKGASEGDNSFAIVYVTGKGDAVKIGADKADIDNILLTNTDGEDAYITGTVSYELGKDDKGEVTGKITEIALTFDGKALENTHKAVYNDHNIFGLKDDVDGCKYEDWKTVVKVNGTETVVYNSIAKDVYHEDSKDIPAIKSIDIKTAAGTLKKGSNTVIVEFEGAVPTDDAKTSAEWDGKYTYVKSTINLNVEVTEEVTGTDIAVTSYTVTPEFASGSTVSGNSCTVK